LAAGTIAVTMIAVVCPLAWRFLRAEPIGAAVLRQPSSSRWVLLRQHRFLTISIASPLGLFAQVGLFSHLIARLEPNFGSTLAAVAACVVTLCAVGGRSLLGWLLDGHDRRLTPMGNLLTQAPGSILLAFGPDAT